MKKAAKKSAIASIASALAAALTVMVGVAVEGMGPKTAQAQTTNPTTKVRFYCYDGGSDPETLVSTPEGINGIIKWRTDFFGPEYPPLERCRQVSGRFQRFQEERRWEYITHGLLNNYPVICLVEYRGQDCSDDSLLLTLRPKDDPKEIMDKLFDIRNYGSPPFYHTGEEVVYEQNDRTYIHIDELISRKRRELLRRDNP
ncbi:MAG: COP23 domain-containing protein [Hormoscilla sp.]